MSRTAESESPVAKAASAEAPPRLLQAGRNCSRIEQATRMAFLVDGEEYFGAVRSALANARHSFFILGWDVDRRMLLTPQGSDDGLPDELGDFLDALVDRNRQLRGFILAWDYSMLYAFEREWQPLFGLGWKMRPRLEFHADDRHPLGASHHQKIIVVDDQVAFVGGFDLAESRWDTSEHLAENPLRVNSSGRPYGPFHDVAAIVEGPCARALGELCRDRWQRATGSQPRARLRPATTTFSAWPGSLAHTLEDVDVAIARTEPAFNGDPGVDEVRQLHLDAIEAARESIFAENQYFTSALIADALALRLAGASAPQLAVIAPAEQSGWLESSTMGVLRARMHRRLRTADTSDRYRMYCPTYECADGPGPCINVHSKVLVIDDVFLTVGSANLSNRSMSLDTECNLAVESAGRADVRSAIAGLRDRLLAEHLGTNDQAVRTAIASEGGLHEAIHALSNAQRRGLKAIDPALDPTVDAVVPNHDVLDPERPLDPDVLVTELLPAPQSRIRLRWRVLAILLLVVLIAGLAFAWRATGLGGALDLEAIFARIATLRGEAWMLLAVPALFVLAGFVLVPVTLLIALTVAVYGGLYGGALAFAGAMASAAAGYALGRSLGRDVVRRYAGRRLNVLSRRLAKRGLLAVLLVRVLPIAPFAVVNVVGGATHLGWRDFLLGTALGLLPGLVMTSAFIDRAIAAVRTPDPGSIALLALLLLTIAVAVVTMQRKLRPDAGCDPAGRSQNVPD
ncbi:MAG: VTT domain-containing protein [Burkholderiales bacterium]|nr:VTT domain-containing protein [Burkholderiales bacterium]